MKADLRLQGIRLESTGEAVRMVAGLALYDVTIADCELSGCPNYFVRAYNVDQSAPYIRLLTIDNCLFRMEKAEGAESGPRAVVSSKMPQQMKNLVVKNTTFDGGERGAGRIIYLHPGEGIEDLRTIEGAVEIDHCTFYNSTDTRGVYLANIDGCYGSNCIFMNTAERENTVSFALYGSNSKIENSLSCNAPINWVPEPYRSLVSIVTRISWMPPTVISGSIKIARP